MELCGQKFTSFAKTEQLHYGTLKGLIGAVLANGTTQTSFLRSVSKHIFHLFDRLLLVMVPNWDLQRKADVIHRNQFVLL